MFFTMGIILKVKWDKIIIIIYRKCKLYLLLKLRIRPRRPINAYIQLKESKHFNLDWGKPLLYTRKEIYAENDFPRSKIIAFSWFPNLALRKKYVYI